MENFHYSNNPLNSSPNSDIEKRNSPALEKNNPSKENASINFILTNFTNEMRNILHESLAMLNHLEKQEEELTNEVNTQIQEESDLSQTLKSEWAQVEERLSRFLKFSSIKMLHLNPQYQPEPYPKNE